MPLKTLKLRLFVTVAFVLVIYFYPLLIIPNVTYGPQKAMAQQANDAPPTPPSSLQHAAPRSAHTPSSSSFTTATTTTGAFQTFSDPILGLKLQYPSNWLLRQHPYNPAGNSTIATFFSPAQSALAAAGAPQGTQNSFIPYIDIFVFNSNGSPLDQLINGSINHGSLLNATISQSKPITLNGGNPARMVEYSIIIADRYLFDRMQVWTENGSKVFVISYTSEPPTYLTDLPTMQQMIRSIEIASAPKTEPSSTTSNNQTNADDGSSSSSSTIPWLR